MKRRTIITGFSALLSVGMMTSPVQAQMTIKVGITPAGLPASGVNPDSKTPEGFSVEIIQAIAVDAGLNIQFEPMPFGELQQSLLDKKIDVIAGSFGITPERQKIVAFTHSYGSYRDILIVKTSNAVAYKSVADLHGIKIATSSGSSYVKPLENAGVEVSLSRLPTESIAKLEAGIVDGVIDNGLQLKFQMHRSGQTGLRQVETYQPILVGYLAFAARKDDADLLVKLDGSLSKLEAAGTVARIKQKWGLD